MSERGSPALALLLVAALAPAANAAPAGCRDAIVAASARFTQATVKALAACARRHVAACDSDPRTVAAVANASARLDKMVAQQCCGGDGACGTPDDEPLAAVGWGAGFCPNLDRGDCNGLIASPDDVATCLACIGRAAARDLVAATTVPEPSSATLARCATAVTKETARLMTSASKALARCWDARAKGRHANPCPVPGDGSAAAAIAAAGGRAATRICKACGGADRVCGGGDDLLPAALGFPATCADVAIPDGASCAGPVDTMSELVGCLVCTVAHDGQCADRAAVPAFEPYPPGVRRAARDVRARRRVHAAARTVRPGMPASTTARARPATVSVSNARRMASAAAEQCAVSTAPLRGARRGAASARDSPAAPTRSASTTAGSPAASCAPRIRTVRLPSACV